LLNAEADRLLTIYDPHGRRYHFLFRHDLLVAVQEILRRFGSHHQRFRLRLHRRVL
jgi:hypothetical protein